MYGDAKRKKLWKCMKNCPYNSFSKSGLRPI